ncbi:MAG: histidine phosphatase family protein [Flavobacteriales bacterium]|nr:histidine phosphatase family protein [Flavobacteriales bacterium]
MFKQFKISLNSVFLVCILFQTYKSNVFAQTDDVFTIYLVRHSEKDYTSNNTSDLPLSACGEQRSQDLSNFLNDIHLDAVYCTDYTRTRNTALPTATAKDIDITLYDTQNLNSFSNHLLTNKQDALVVGHTYSTGVLAGLLTNQNIGDIDLDIYNRIYQVVICGESRKLNLFNSSFECIE